MIDTDSILHPDTFTEHTSSLVSDMLVSWDKVVRNFDFLSDHIQKVVNKIIRRQNEIHARIEQKRPWATTTYTVSKFDNLGDTIRAHIMDSREVITGEKAPLIAFDIKRELLINAHDHEVFDEYFTRYETDLANSVALKRKNAEQVAAQILRADFETAKEFYFKHKDHFEKLEQESEAKVLPFEEWEAEFYKKDLHPDIKRDFEATHGLNLDDEIAKIKKDEYALYVQRVKLGIE